MRPGSRTFVLRNFVHKESVKRDRKFYDNDNKFARTEIIDKYKKLFELKEKLRVFSPQANYTDRTTAVCRRS
jgi:hypothetical protein